MATVGSAMSTSTPILQRKILGSGIQGIRHYSKTAAVATSTAAVIITSKAKAQEQQQIAAKENKNNDGAMLLAGAFFATLATAESAKAAQEVIEIAAATTTENDSRGLALLIPLVPAIGWVLFNILQPGLNQLNRMRSAKGIAIGLGMGGLTAAALLATPNASAAVAAQQIAEIAESDSRGLVLLGVLLPAIGWVVFNILQPGLNQLNKMRNAKSVIGGIGIGMVGGASIAPLDADAAQEIASIAEGDSRGLLLLLVILPAIGWVLFNILQPALNQINKMRQEK